MYVQVRTDNQIVSDEGANARLEQRLRTKLKRYAGRLGHVELHVADVNGNKRGPDKRVSLELRANGHAPIVVHADAQKVDVAVTAAADKALRALDHALGRQKDSKGH
jgi:hypothetical protein